MEGWGSTVWPNFWNMSVAMWEKVFTADMSFKMPRKPSQTSVAAQATSFPPLAHYIPIVITLLKYSYIQSRCTALRSFEEGDLARQWPFGTKWSCRWTAEEWIMLQEWFGKFIQFPPCKNLSAIKSIVIDRNASRPQSPLFVSKAAEPFRSLLLSLATVLDSACGWRVTLNSHRVPDTNLYLWQNGYSQHDTSVHSASI